MIPSDVVRKLSLVYHSDKLYDKRLLNCVSATRNDLIVSVKHRRRRLNVTWYGKLNLKGIKDKCSITILYYSKITRLKILL